MTREEIKNTPELVDRLLDESVIADSRNKLHERIDKICNFAIKALEQESCEDAVSRRAVLDLIEHYNSDGLGSVFYGYEQGAKFADAINKLPPVAPQPKTGHWIEDEYEMKVWCSECGEENDMCSKYCPNCRAKMEVENNG